MPKTIFNSSEKSNFILNMTEEQYTKYASRGLFIAMLTTPLLTIVPELSYSLSTSTTVSYAFSAAGLVIGGVIAMILAIIGIMKNYVSKRTAFPAVAMGIMVLWAVVSLIKGCDLSISMYGYPNRGEGLLAIIFYFCFFVTAMCIKREKGLRTILDGIVGVGVLNSIIALVQIFTGELGHYKYISLQLCVNAASGLSMSPLFLAMVLTLSLTAALIGFVTSDCKKRRTILLVISAVFSFIMMFTYSFIGVCGLAFAVIAAFAAVFVMKAPKSRLACIPVSIVSAAAAVALVYSGAIGNISSYSLYDGRILWFQDGYSRASASGMYNPDVIDIDNTADVYLYMNSRTMDIIEHNPLFGTGPDQLAFALIRVTEDTNLNMDMTDFIPMNKGVFDKVYNEYLYVAASRGIPSLIFFVLTLLAALVLGRSSYKKKRTPENFTVLVLLVGGVLVYLIGCSSIPYAPVFWTVAGAACAAALPEEKKKAVAAAGKKVGKAGETVSEAKKEVSEVKEKVSKAEEKTSEAVKTASGAKKKPSKKAKKKK